jgi:prepilin-type N-terminal cleavage/methylation domain-containing protein
MVMTVLVAEKDGPMSEVPEVSSLRRLNFGDAAEAGLTLIELLVVLLIISVLLAIVIPTFTKTTETAQSTFAPANLLYTTNSQSHFGTCGETALSSATAVHTGSRSVRGIRSAKAHAVSTSSNGATNRLVPAVVSPLTTNCWITVYQKATQPTRASDSSDTSLATGTYF